MPRRPKCRRSGRPEGGEIARHHPDPLGLAAGVERIPHAGGDLADFAVRTRGLDALELELRATEPASTARSRAIRIKRSRSRLRETAAGVGLGRPRGIGRLVDQHARVAMADELLDQLRAQTGRVGEAVDPDGARREALLRGREPAPRAPRAAASAR